MADSLVVMRTVALAYVSMLLSIPVGAAECEVGATECDSSINVGQIVREAAETMRIAKFATLATVAADGTISGRMVYPKPPNATLGESPDLYFVRFATLSQSRKFFEIQANPHATLVYYDDAGKGEVTLKGVVRVCSSMEATELWYDRWKSNYPQGPETPFYTLLRFEPTTLEFVSYVRFKVDEGGKRSDWRPLTLQRSNGGTWQYSPPSAEVMIS